MTASSIVAQGVAKANLSLTAVNSNVRCAVDPLTPTLAHCTMAKPLVDGGEGSSSDAPGVGVPVSFQVNDTGLARTILAGPSKDVQTATQVIHATGGIKNVQTFNFVGGATCSPCSGTGGPTCCAAATIATPALGGPWGSGALALVLGTAGFALLGRGRRTRATGSA
jgi:hypothetical protein